MTNKRRLYFTFCRLLFLIACVIFFWFKSIVWVVEKLQIPGVSILNGIISLLNLSYYKALDIQLYFGKLGTWYVKPDFEYFIILLVLIILLLRSNLKSYLKLGFMVLCFFIPQIILLLALAYVCTVIISIFMSNHLKSNS